MIYTFLLLLIFSVFLIIKSYINKYAWFFSFMIFVLDIAILGLVLYIVKTAQYPYPKNNFFLPDYKLFMLFNRSNIHYYTIIRVINVCTSIYIALVPLFVSNLINFEISTVKIKKILIICGFFLLPIFYIWFYDPKTNYNFYLSMFQISDKGKSDFVFLLIKLADLFCYIGAVCYLILPVIYLILFYKKAILNIKKKQIITTGLCLIILNFIYIILFVISPYKEIYFFSNSPVSLLNVRNSLWFSPFYYTFLPVLLLIMIFIAIFMLMKYRGLDNVDLFKQYMLNKNIKGLNENLRNVFHSFKNTLFIINIMITQCRDSNTPEEKDRLLDELFEMNLSQMERITKMLNSIRDIHLTTSKFDIIKLIEQAILRVPVKDNIEIVRNYTGNDNFIMADDYHIVEALANIIQNAYDAVLESGRKNGIITIDVFTECEWVAVKINDNGKGISKTDINNIFKAFYTTKSRQNNWGVGLSQSYRIITKHLGYISVESTPDKCTTFQILLPKLT